MTPDIAIVLGGGRVSQDELAARTNQRVDHAAALFRSGRVARLLMTGGISYLEGTARGASEATLMRERASGAGVPPEAIWLEERSRETLGNAYFSRVDVLDPNEWRRVLVITSDFHVARARALFEKVLFPDFRCAFEPVPSPAPDALAEWAEQERRASDVYSRLLAHIDRGDLVAIGALLHKAYDALDRKPDLALDELEQLLRDD